MLMSSPDQLRTEHQPDHGLEFELPVMTDIENSYSHDGSRNLSNHPATSPYPGEDSVRASSYDSTESETLTQIVERIFAESSPDSDEDSVISAQPLLSLPAPVAQYNHHPLSTVVRFCYPLRQSLYSEAPILMFPRANSDLEIEKQEKSKTKQSSASNTVSANLRAAQHNTRDLPRLDRRKSHHQSFYHASPCSKKKAKRSKAASAASSHPLNLGSIASTVDYPKSEALPIHGSFSLQSKSSEIVYCITFSHQMMPNLAMVTAAIDTERSQASTETTYELFSVKMKSGVR